MNLGFEKVGEIWVDPICIRVRQIVVTGFGGGVERWLRLGFGVLRSICVWS